MVTSGRSAIGTQPTVLSASSAPVASRSEEQQKEHDSRAARAAADQCRGPEDVQAAPPSTTSVRAVLRIPEACMLLATALFFFLAFMWMQFLSAWVVQHVTDSPRLVQLTGFFQMAPNLLGPPLGSLADRVSKKRMEAVFLGLMLASSVAMALAVALEWPADLMGPEVLAADGI